MTTYWQKLKDPRWQRKKNSILERAGYECSNCGADDKTLHAHHRIYRKNTEPWDYEDEVLSCLCEDCHKNEHIERDRLAELLALSDESELGRICGYIQGCRVANGIDCAMSIDSHEDAEGFSDATGKDPESVIKYFLKNKRICPPDINEIKNRRKKKNA